MEPKETKTAGLESMAAGDPLSVEEKISGLKFSMGLEDGAQASLWRCERANSPREYLDDLNPDDIRLSYIKRTYGGGGYAITVNGPDGRMRHNIMFRIAGPAKVEPQAGGAPDQFAAVLQELRSAQKASEDRNFELLKLMVQNQGGGGGGGFTFKDALALAQTLKEMTAPVGAVSPLDALREAREMMTLLKQEDGGGADGNAWGPIISEGLAAFNQLLASQPAASPARVVPSRPKSLSPGGAPVKTAAESDNGGMDQGGAAAVPPALLKQIAVGLSDAFDNVSDDSQIVDMILKSSPPALLTPLLALIRAKNWESTFRPLFPDWKARRARLVSVRAALLSAVEKKEVAKTS